jgi:hypothetical protein
MVFTFSGDDHQLEVQLLRDKINELETEKKDFGVQRAKMKSLMLQTEGRFVQPFMLQISNKLTLE